MDRVLLLDSRFSFKNVPWFQGHRYVAKTRAVGGLGGVGGVGQPISSGRYEVVRPDADRGRGQDRAGREPAQPATVRGWRH